MFFPFKNRIPTILFGGAKEETPNYINYFMKLKNGHFVLSCFLSIEYPNYLI